MSSQVSSLIYPGYLHEDNDIKELLDGTQLMNSLTKHCLSFHKAVGAEVHRIDIPGSKYFEIQTEEYWRCTIMYMTRSGAHLVGSCKMEPRDRGNSVVDPICE